MNSGRSFRIGKIEFDAPVTPTLVAVLVLTFGLSAVLPDAAPGESASQRILGTIGMETLWASGANAARGVTQNHEGWRLLSAVYLHANLLHIGLNLLSLWSLGRVVQALYGPARLIIAWTLTGVLASLSSVLWRALHGEPMIGIGASGAVCGLLGLVLAFTWRGIDIASTMYRAQLIQSALLTLIMGLMIPNIDNSAHIGGFVAGLALGKFFQPLFRQPSYVSPAKDLPALAAIACVVLTVATLLWVGFSTRSRHDWIRQSGSLSELSASDELHPTYLLDLSSENLRFHANALSNSQAPPEITPHRDQIVAALLRLAMLPQGSLERADAIDSFVQAQMALNEVVSSHAPDFYR